MLLRKIIDPCRCWGANGRAAFVGMVALVLLTPIALNMAVTPLRRRERWTCRPASPRVPGCC